MIYTTPIKLISVVQSQDSVGNVIETETSKDVYVRKKNVGVKEYYMSDLSGWKAEAEFEIFKTDYTGQKYIEHNGQKMMVIRTIDKDGLYMVLVCGEKYGKE